jgi:hypothetical protein
MTANPQKTYALVVGLEQYAAGSKWDLDGPASDACKFVEWLRGQHVPDENIFLYLSPLDKNASLAGPGTKAATRENIYHALTYILPSKKEGTLLYLFWGGHGMITPDNKRLLFYADATQQNIQNLDLNSLLTSLRSNYFPGFDQQIFFIDVCANYVANWRVYGTLPEETFPGGDPLATREQFVCLAAKPGEFAKNVTEQQTGLFSQVVLEELAKVGDEFWPPDMEALVTSIDTRFDNLREAGVAKQTPTQFWYKNWSGGERSYGSVPDATKVESGSEETPAPGLTFEQQQELAELLWACANSMRPRNKRELVLRGLPQVVQAAMNRDYQNDVTDIQLILEACLNYPDGLRGLLKIVRTYERGSLPVQKIEVFIKKVLPELA